MKKKRVSPESLPASAWQPATEVDVKEAYEAYLAKKLKRKTKTFLGGYGLVTYRVRKPKKP